MQRPLGPIITIYENGRAFLRKKPDEVDRSVSVEPPSTLAIKNRTLISIVQCCTPSYSHMFLDHIGRSAEPGQVRECGRVGSWTQHAAAMHRLRCVWSTFWLTTTGDNLNHSLFARVSREYDKCKHIPMSSSDGFNIILFGETGVGKSSLINLLSGKPVAKVSSDVDHGTLKSTKYTLSLGSAEVRIWDTIGLEEPTIGVSGYLTAIEKAHTLIRELGNAGGVDLLLFCIRGSRITATTQGNYRLFHEVLCNKEVPIAVVVTNLERESRMEEWWERNEKHIQAYGIHSVGHACVTGIEEDEKYGESKDVLRNLLLSQLSNRRRFSMQPESWFARLLAGLGSFLQSRSPPKGDRMVRMLVKRCNMDADTARRLTGLLTN